MCKKKNINKYSESYLFLIVKIIKYAAKIKIYNVKKLLRAMCAI